MQKLITSLDMRRIDKGPPFVMGTFNHYLLLHPNEAEEMDFKSFKCRFESGREHHYIASTIVSL